MKNYIVTGGAGFIGANLVRELLRRSDVNIFLIIEKNMDLWRLQDVLEKINFIDADLTDYEQLVKQIEFVRPDVIYHLAAYGGLPGQLDQRKIFEVNFYGTVNLLNACKKVGFECFINTGSSSEYGMKTDAMSEDDVLHPLSDYGVAKAAATQLCLKEALFNKLPVYTVRPFSVYGDFEMPGRLIPSILVNALLGQRINLSGPDFVRDFIYVKDFVECCIKLADVKPDAQFVFNVGSGIQYTIKDVADTVQAIFLFDYVDICWGQSQARPWEPSAWRANRDRAEKFIGWRPKHSLSDGLSKSLRWYKENINFYVRDYEKKDQFKSRLSGTGKQGQAN